MDEQIILRKQLVNLEIDIAHVERKLHKLVEHAPKSAVKQEQEKLAALDRRHVHLMQQLENFP